MTFALCGVAVFMFSVALGMLILMFVISLLVRDVSVLVEITERIDLMPSSSGSAWGSLLLLKRRVH